MRALKKNSRISYLDLARDLKVSGGTIHQRVNKMKGAGVIKRFGIDLDGPKLGFGVVAFIGVFLRSAREASTVLSKLGEFNEVLEAYYTTGNYALILKIAMKDIPALQEFLMHKLQALNEIQSTETFIVLSNPIRRDVLG